MEKIELREIRTLGDAIRLLDEYAESQREWIYSHRRLEDRVDDLEFMCSYYSDLLRYLDPFLPGELQDEKLRAANEQLYRNIAANMEREQEREECPF